MIANESVVGRPQGQPTVEMAKGTGAIIVASDGATESDAAFKAAREIAQRDGARVEVVAVLENMPIVTPDFGLVPPPLTLDEERKRALLSRVEYQVATYAGDGAQWPVEVRYGQPARTIARVARERKARMIVMGVGHHGVLDRLAGGETTLQVVRLTDVPVLAVTPEFESLPRRVLIAVDFSPSSIRAARVSLTLIPDYATIYLAHVKPRIDLPAPGWETWGLSYDSALPPAFARLRAALDVPAEYYVETVTLAGDPVKELLDFARGAEVDLIACGSQGHDFLERLLVGSVATGLIRAARCATLIVPTPVAAGARALGDAGEGRTIVDPPEWAPRLEEFTQRNVGRRAMLETDDPDLGAQAQGFDFPFIGAAYDRRDGRVELMFGEDGKQHLTRSIGDVAAIDILEAPDGQDRVLRIAHGDGQTLLTFTP